MWRGEPAATKRESGVQAPSCVDVGGEQSTGRAIDNFGFEIQNKGVFLIFFGAMSAGYQTPEMNFAERE
jgi:hypothetical protein